MGIRMRHALAATAVLAMLLVLPACSGQQGFHIKNLAKSDIDFVSDAGYRRSDALLRELAEKLYKRNPRELAKWPGASRDERIQQLFGREGRLEFAALGGKSGTEAMELAFSEDFGGDRVFALMAGLTDMIRRAYGYQAEFFMFDALDSQKLYNSARNLEIVAWRLTHKRDSQQRLFLLTNSRGDEPRNLSYERLFGELVAIQDFMSDVVARKRDRVINKVAINLASYAFLPL